ncbi:DUF924 family protein [Microcoleus sp. FACHB-672]|uniref:DUF924 family protein n=1 Tax=Microcoleus sp. FACHB-672 TaxID=2692825 RepID=UPI0016865E46|nr:DUF924 family protein [Microcoleus sp. FACHB-672]MBD2039169.1 DUF924 domain-containing protein [Microcoleus sp. FACHB-672]
MNLHPQVNEILNFWFGYPEDAEYGNTRNVWYTKNPAFDEEIRSRFFTEYELAAAGKYDSWQEVPQSCLALIIVLDQFPRNMFRGQPQAFATDYKALAAAQYAVDHKFDQQLLPVQRQFIYLPFEHSENLEHQRRCVELFQQLKDSPDSALSLDYAIRHLKIIEQFGRFPHRNEILGRESTAEEVEFLKQAGSSF